MSMIAAFSHFAFTVSDIERSVAWYRDVLGLELVVRQRQDNEYTRAMVGIPGAVLEVAEFRTSRSSPGAPGVMLELIEYVTPKGVELDLRTQNVGVAHLSFEVDDIHAEYERLKHAGVVFANLPVSITAGVNNGGYGCYFRDPDGITLELFQPPEPAVG
jgi:lactoylglutathione lyase